MGSPHQPLQSARSEPVERSDLTVRQQQILNLVRAGKGNKDIALELGIGLGTVKQHVVALFRKLNVESRAQAISQSRDDVWTAGGGESFAAPLGGAVELRPACILSIAAIGEDAAAFRLLNRAAAIAAADHLGTLVAAPGAGIDIIFGLHRVGERDAVAAWKAAHDLAAQADEAGVQLRAAAAAGFLLASMHERGGWSGESVAGRAIARAREMRADAPPGALRLDAAMIRLLDFQDVDLKALSWRGDDAAALLPAERNPPSRLDDSSAGAVVGRMEVLAGIRECLDAAGRDGRGGAALIEGENGMGKTALCRLWSGIWGRGGGRAVRLRCGDGTALRNAAGYGRKRGRPSAKTGAAEALDGVRRLAGDGAVLLVLDNLHRADAEEADFAAGCLALARQAPLHVLGAGRRMRDGRLTKDHWDYSVVLGRLDGADSQALVADLSGGGLPAETCRGIVDLAQGVPLFLVELTRAALTDPQSASPALPHSLISLVAARLDPLGLHRGLLRLIVRLDGQHYDNAAAHWPARFGDLQAELSKAVENGVLVGAPGKSVGFRHPLVREAVRCLMSPDHFAGAALV